MTSINIGCGSFRAPAPWINLDAHQGDGVDPDILVADPMRPLDELDATTIEHVYLGHVLEHIPWPDVSTFLQYLEHTIPSGTHICIVGPDVLRIIRRWHEGLDPEGWLLVESCMENPWDRCYGQDDEIPYGFIAGDGIIPAEPRWKHARHWWNCYESRVLYAMRAYTTFTDVTAQPITPEALGAWPLVAYTQWQCAVTATKP